ncbi:MAG: CPBP family intramembrane metalloprotease [Planctomycetes bacterium]|nr:CPBP family intramembrane metalloprotease [Planctomycetota bacterium]
MAATVAIAAVVVSVATTVRGTIGGERSSDRLGELAQEALRSDAFTWITVIVSQATLLACALVACRWLGKPARERLGLAQTGLRPLEGVAMLVATAVPFALGLGVASLASSLLGTSTDDASGLQRWWSEGSRGASVAWILCIAIVPASVEELFYRGFLQRGLLQRWGPVASILTSSLLFAAVHGEFVWALAILPLGAWFGVVAWRTGSVRMTIAMHAAVNGLWTAGMMRLHRDPASEPALTWIAGVVLALGVVALPWAIAILRRTPQSDASAPAPREGVFVPRFIGAVAVAGALFAVFVPPGAAPTIPAPTARRTAPTLEELEAGAAETVVCPGVGDEGAVEFSLAPGAGARVALPKNRVGVDEVIVTLDANGEVVWLAYAGERSGKGAKRRPVGVVEQLAPGDPTVLCMTLSDGPPPVTVRLTLEEDERRKAEWFARAEAQGWSLRGRR